MLSLLFHWIFSLQQIDLRGYNTRTAILTLILPVQLYPILQILQAFPPRYIIHKNRSIGIPEIGRHQALILLLSCCVPKLQAKGGTIDRKVPGEEIDANCRLNVDDVTLLLESNSSLMNRSMIDVLPTPISPRKTNLNFVSQRLVLYSMWLDFDFF